MALSRRLVAVSTAAALVLASFVAAAPAVAAGTATIAGTLLYPADAKAFVELYQLQGDEFVSIGGGAPEADGKWDFEGVDAGQYRVAFLDNVEDANYVQQFFPGVVTDDVEDDRITTINVAEGQNVTGVDGELKIIPLTDFPTPVIVGKLAVGSELEIDLGGWELLHTVGISYTWLRNGKPIEDEEFETFEVTSADVNKRISVIAVAGEAGYYSETRTSAAVKIGLGNLVAAKVKITGKAIVGKKLKAVAGKWTPGKVTFTYQWRANGKAIKKATKVTFKPTSAQVGKKISVIVTGTQPGYKTVVVKSGSTKKVK